MGKDKEKIYCLVCKKYVGVCVHMIDSNECDENLRQRFAKGKSECVCLSSRSQVSYVALNTFYLVCLHLTFVITMLNMIKL